MYVNWRVVLKNTGVAGGCHAASRAHIANRRGESHWLIASVMQSCNSSHIFHTILTTRRNFWLLRRLRRCTMLYRSLRNRLRRACGAQFRNQSPAGHPPDFLNGLRNQAQNHLWISYMRFLTKAKSLTVSKKIGILWTSLCVPYEFLGEKSYSTA